MPTKPTKSPWSAEITNTAKSIWTKWTADKGWEPLGIKASTATKRASADGKGGTRPAMLAVMAAGYKDASVAAQLVAAIRHTYLGCSAINTNGISFAWFTVQLNLETVTSGAVFRAEKDGTMRLAPKPRAAKTANVVKRPKPAASADSRNGEVKTVRPSDKVLAEQAAIAAS